MNKRVVVTGLGVVAPNATGLENFRSAIRAGKSGIEKIPLLEDLKFACQIAGIPDVSEELKRQYLLNLVSFFYMNHKYELHIFY